MFDLLGLWLGYINLSHSITETMFADPNEI